MSKLSLEFRAMDAMHSMGIAVDLAEKLLEGQVDEYADRTRWALYSAHRRARELYDAITEAPGHINRHES